MMFLEVNGYINLTPNMKNRPTLCMGWSLSLRTANIGRMKAIKSCAVLIGMMIKSVVNSLWHL